MAALDSPPRRKRERNKNEKPEFHRVASRKRRAVMRCVCVRCIPRSSYREVGYGDMLMRCVLNDLTCDDICGLGIERFKERIDEVGGHIGY